MFSLESNCSPEVTKMQSAKKTEEQKFPSLSLSLSINFSIFSINNFHLFSYIDFVRCFCMLKKWVKNLE